MTTELNKTAITQYPIHPLLAERWSPRAFSGQPIPAHVLGSLLEAARWSPSSSNEQPWRFVLIRREDEDAHSRMVETLSGSNRLWAHRAPLLIVGVAAKLRSRNGTPNAHAWYDLGQSVAHLSVQASAAGLHVHQMGGFDREKARIVLEISNNFEPAVTIAVGYLGDMNDLPDDLQTREANPRSRRPLQETVFDGKWGEAARL
ncbi:MAG: nitroreductase family protein [Caldilineaceae bacterium]|nr:nitroreductase family protein [Caldilineaceae bacterium]